MSVNITRTHAVYTFAVDGFEPFAKERGGLYDILISSLTVEIRVADGALMRVGTVWEGRGIALTQDGKPTKRPATHAGNNFLSLPAEVREAIKVALADAAGQIADPDGQLDGLDLRKKGNR